MFTRSHTRPIVRPERPLVLDAAIYLLIVTGITTAYVVGIALFIAAAS